MNKSLFGEGAKLQKKAFLGFSLLWLGGYLKITLEIYSTCLIAKFIVVSVEELKLWYAFKFTVQYSGVFISKCLSTSYDTTPLVKKYYEALDSTLPDGSRKETA